MKPLRPRLVSLALALLCLLAPAAAHAQAYTSIVVIGDSLSDTGNDATISSQLYTVNAQVPGPASGYTNGRFTDGLDTSPAARLYTGVWIEQLAAQFAAKPPVLNSLAGGTNYAYGYATTGAGMGSLSYGPSNVFTIPVNNLGLQLSTYLATKPTITSKTLYVVWGGANDLLQANGSASIITAAAGNETALVQQLITAGATDFLVVNLPPLGLVPEFNGSTATSVPATAAAQGFNQALAAGLATLPAANPGKPLRLFQLDVATLFNTIAAAPATYGFANITAMSQLNLLVNPDTYLFWDMLHPTTYGHSLVASTALHLLNGPNATSAAVTSSNLTANLGTSLTFTATVTSTSGSPQGTVTFLDGTTVLGTSLVTGSTTAASAKLATSTLAAGAHSITASFAGANGYSASTSAALSQTLIAPSFSATGSPTSLTIQPGSSGSSTITITPAGGYTGAFTIACTSPAVSVTCSVASSTLAVTAASTVSTAVQINASTLASSHLPARPGAPAAPLPVLAILPLAGLLLATRKRLRSVRSLPLLLALLAVSGAALLGLAGCSGSSASTPVPLTVTIPVTVTPATGTATTIPLVVTVP